MDLMTELLPSLRLPGNLAATTQPVDSVWGLQALFGWLGLPDPLPAILAAILSSILLVTFVALSAIFFIWLERKVAGRIQDRLCPTRVGGRFGWLQTIADGIKLLVKEDLIPAAPDPMLFRLRPYIAFCRSFVAFVA